MSKTNKTIFMITIAIILFLLFGRIASLFLSKNYLSKMYTLINFIAVIWLIKYIFQKFQLPLFREKLAEKYSFFKKLENIFKNLKEQNIIAQKEIKDQDKLFEHLKTKINTWNTARKMQQEENLAGLETIIKHHKKRINTQQQNIKQQKLIKEVFPRVISGTYEQLKQKFTQEQEANIFLKDIINYMKKNTKKELIKKEFINEQ